MAPNIFERKKGISEGQNLVDFQGEFNQLSNTLQNVSNLFGREGEQIADTHALEAGRMAGQMVGAKVPTSELTEADRIYKEAFLKANNGILQQTARQQIEKARNEIMNDPNFNNGSLLDYQHRAKGIATAILQKTPQELEPEIKNYLSYTLNQNQQIIANKVNALTRNQAKEVGFDSANNLVPQILNSAYSEDEPDLPKTKALLGQFNGNIDSLVAAGLYDGKAASATKFSLYRKIQEQHLLGQANRAFSQGNDSAIKFMQDFSNKTPKQLGIDPELKNKIAIKLNTMVKQREQSLGISKKSLDNQIDNTVAMVRRGKIDEDVAMTTRNKIMEFEPSKLEDFNEKIESANYYHSLYSGAIDRNPLQAQQFLNSHIPQPNDPLFANKEKEYKKVQADYANYRKSLANDYAGTLFKNDPGVAHVAERESVSLNSSGGKITPNAGTANVDEYLVEKAKSLDVNSNDITVIPKSEAITIVNQLNNKNTSGMEKRAILVSLASQHGKYMPYVMNALSKAGLQQNVQMVLSAMNNPESRDQIENLDNWLGSDQKSVNDLIKSKGIKELSIQSAINSNLSKFEDSLDGYNYDASKDKTNVRNQVELYAKYLIAAKGLSVSDAVETAANTLVNNNFNYVTLNGHTIQVRRDIQPSNLVDATRYLINEAKNADIKVPALYRLIHPALNDQELMDAYKTEKLDHAYLLMDKNQQEATLVDDDGVAVQLPFSLDNPKGNYKINVDDLNNPNSQLIGNIINFENTSKIDPLEPNFSLATRHRFSKLMNNIRQFVDFSNENETRRLQFILTKAKEQGRLPEIEKKLQELQSIQDITQGTAEEGFIRTSSSFDARVINDELQKTLDDKK